MKIITQLFCSIKVVLVLMAIYAIACGIATFIEKYDGTLAARLWIYDAFWFEMLHLWLVACLIGCLITSKAWQRKKYASLLLHVSFIVIIIGAGITRYYGFEGIMELREGESVNTISTNENYIFIQVKNPQGNVESVRIPTYIDEKVNHKINQHFKFFGKPLTIHTEEFVAKGDMSALVMLYANIDFLGKNEKTFIMRDGNNAPTRENITMVVIEGYTILLAWGTDRIALPFSIKLNHFELERYPGSNSPASYASEVEVLDGENPPLPFRIFMNNVLDYGGYRFFQSSYHPDEKGSILSVNNDPGKIPTYIGYAMLILGAIWLLFDKNGRFAALGRFLKTQQAFCLGLCIALGTITIPHNLHATQPHTQSESKKLDKDIADITNKAKSFGAISKEFDKILMQDFGGRTKPINTLANEYIHKITQKAKFLGLDSTQVFLTMIFFPDEMQHMRMIATKSPKLRQILGLDENQKYIAYIDVFADGQYLLQNYIESANLKNPASRDTFEKDVIKVDERINYAFLIYTGQVLRIFPDSKSPNNQWLTPIDAVASAVAQKDMQRATHLLEIYKNFGEGVRLGLDNNQWDKAIQAIQNIRDYQQKYGHSTLISSSKIDSEILLNTYNPFFQLTLPYIIISIIFFIIVLNAILKNKPLYPLLHKVFYIILLGLFIIHTCALGLRWYVSGHAPWSNAYESMLYIAWAAILSGVVFFRRSNLALCASSFLAGITLFVAHLSDMDPQIGNLVPVLKSYWLNIHVSVITASYGFLGLCFVLGIITLLMFILRNPKIPLKTTSRENVTNSILSLTALNEMSMILGLFLLSIGNFIGGIWANESWGRYWGWDSKETWSLISIGVYAIILHLRFVCARNIPFIFTTASVIGFFSVLMTYFGVNYYLTGMHSYAAGEAAPLPLWVKIIVPCIFMLIFVASRSRQLDMPKIS